MAGSVSPHMGRYSTAAQKALQRQNKICGVREKIGSELHIINE